MSPARLAVLVAPLSLAACGPCGDGFEYWFCHVPAADETESNSGSVTQSSTETMPPTSTEGSMSDSMSMSSTADTTADTTGPDLCGNGRCDTDEMVSCPNDCQCGDGVVDDDEFCDDGLMNTAYAQGAMICNLDCSAFAPYCGDGTCENPLLEDANSCSPDCLPDCPNGVVEMGEKCDDGNIVNSDACLNNCTKAACGDGVTWTGMEGCDDGNIIDTDSCLNSCAMAKCGDGFVWAGMESCDDGNISDVDFCDNNCEPVEHRKVFLTSSGYDGSMSGMPGLAGADARCNADKGVLTGNFKAWLSDGRQGPANRFDKSFTGVYELPGADPMDPNQAILVAHGWDGLTTQPLVVAINRFASGMKNPAPSSTVWTNTAPDGTPLEMNNCSDWSSADTMVSGGYGRANLTDKGWTDSDTFACELLLRLYCFEDSQ